MASMSVEELVDNLARFPRSEFVANPYSDEACRSNLQNYLQHLQHVGVNVMLIGEAPGYRGCVLTGSPFTDPRQLRNPANEFALGAWEKCLPSNVSQEDSERTASCVWSVLRESRVVPLLWNIFSFHPHERGDAKSNRTPTSAELVQGLRFAEELIEMFGVDDDLIYAVGRKAQRQLNLDDDRYICHPSYGKSKLFAEQFKAKVLNRTERVFAEI